jgi:hypothetical protein
MRKAARSLELATGLAVLMAAGAAEPASARNREIEPGAVTITLRVYDYVHLDRSRLLAAEGEAAAILAQACIEARWVDCPTSEAELDKYPDCPSAWQANDFVLRVLPKAMESRAKWQEALGSTPECGAVGLCTSSIFFDGVTGLAEG